MRLAKAWTVASKDFKIFLKKKGILYSSIGFEIVVAVGLPFIIGYAAGKGAGPAELAVLMNAFSFLFVIGAALIPAGIASYSLVGEKVQKSLEPLLATPTTDDEILAGKAIAAFIPSIVATYIGAAIFILLTDTLSFGSLGYLYFPNWGIGVILLLLVPLACILSIEVDVLVSARVNDVRTAQQLGTLMFVPFMAVYVLAEIGVIPLTITSLLVMSGALFLADIAVFYAARATFQREEILTRWQ